MMKFPHWLDDFLLRRVFTPIAHYYEYKTGNTNFRLVWYSYGIATISIMNALWRHVTNREYFGIVIDLVCLLVVGIQMLVAHIANEQLKGVYRSYLPPDVLALTMPFRLLWVWLSLSNIGIVTIAVIFGDPWLNLAMDSLWALGTACGAYFAHIPRPPPKPRKQEAGFSLREFALGKTR